MPNLLYNILQNHKRYLYSTDHIDSKITKKDELLSTVIIWVTFIFIKLIEFNNIYILTTYFVIISIFYYAVVQIVRE